MSSPTILVTAATGKQGGATARALIKEGARVHAVVRDLKSDAALELKQLGAVLYQGDFDDKHSILVACKHCTGVYINVSPSFTDPSAEVRHAKNIIAAAKEAGSVTSLVYSGTILTGEHETFPGWEYWGGSKQFAGQYWLSKSEIERLLEGAGFNFWTVLHPVTFMSNYLAPDGNFFFPELKREHLFRTALTPTTKTMLISPDDLGKVAAEILIYPAKYNQLKIDVGSEALTPGEIVKTLSKVSGKEIRAIEIDKKESQELAKSSHIINAQFFFNEKSANMDRQLLRDRFPKIVFEGFEEFLERKKDLVVTSFL
ncbi:NAD dependent epimerase [Phlyctema vagabunda]|uniref:NAD dependent epimerase n=1 Tax=Phlyctema vagabunda TaxID=108571 RepID=A0ABR4PL34_9HELO